MPLLKPVDCISTGEIPEPVVQAPRKSAAWESRFSKDIDQVIGKLNEYIENAPKTATRGSISSMELTSMDLDVSFIPFLDNGENKKYIARTIVGLNEALKADESRQKSSFLFVIPEVTLEEMLESIFAAWKALADSQERPFQSLFVIKQPEELIEDFLVLGRERSAGKPRESCYAGGNYSLMMHRVEPQKSIKAVKTIENKKVSIRRKKILHKLLIDLVIMGSQFGLKNLRICRALKAGGLAMEEVENTLTAFTTDREVQAHDLEIFNFQFARFLPFFNLLNLRSFHNEPGRRDPGHGRQYNGVL